MSATATTPAYTTRNGFQRRIDKLTRERKEAERRATEAEQKLARSLDVIRKFRVALRRIRTNG
jgi:hypothetical protein